MGDVGSDFEYMISMSCYIELWINGEK